MRRQHIKDFLSSLGEAIGCLFALAVAAVVLLAVVSFLGALWRDWNHDTLDCRDWSPGKVAESPHDLACEAQWDDQLNELSP